MVPLSKLNEKVRVYVDYRDLSRACPKDDFPIPNINLIFESFVDGLVGYNQIKMHHDYQEKTAFITPWVLTIIQSYHLG